MKQCTKCGFDNLNRRRTCFKCGEQLEKNKNANKNMF